MKKMIKKVLKDEKMIEKISIMRTQFSHIMTEFYFFNTFIQSLKTANIDIKIQKVPLVVNIDKVVNECYMIIDTEGKHTSVKYNENKLFKELEQYNYSQGDMGFRNSTLALIDIFIGLFE